MTIRVSAWAWRQSDISPKEKLVLLAIAEQIDFDQRLPFAPRQITKLSNVTGMTGQSVRRRIVRMAGQDILRVEVPNGHRYAYISIPEPAKKRKARP